MRAIKNIGELKDLAQEMKSHYGELETKMYEDETYYDLNFQDELNMPTKFKKDAVVLPTAREIIDTATDHVTPVFRRVYVPKRSATPSATEQARKLQRFYESFLNYVERSAAVSPYRENVKHLAMYGITIGKLLPDKNKGMRDPRRSEFDSDEEFSAAKEEFESIRSLHMPFTYRVVNPKDTYLDPWNDPPQWGIEHYTRSVGHVQSVYPNWPNPDNKKITDKVEVFEYWDNDYRAVMIENVSALKSKDDSGILRHGWGVHPYVIVSSGLGVDDSEHNPVRRYVGLLRYIRSVLLAESRMFSIADIVLKGSAWPVRVAEGEQANRMPKLKLEYGELQPLPPGVKITDLTPNLPPNMVFDFMAMSNNIISAATAPRVVRGLSAPGTQSGYDRSLQLGQARLRYGPIASSIETLLTVLCQKAGILMERAIKTPVNVGVGTTQDEFMNVSGAAFKGHHAVVVNVNVLEPEDEVRKHQDGIQMVSAGVMSPQDFIRKYRPDVDVDSELGRIVAARILFSPDVMALLSQGAAAKIAQNAGLMETINQTIMQSQAEMRARGVQNGRTPANQEGEAAQNKGSRADQAQGRILDLRETGS